MVCASCVSDAARYLAGDTDFFHAFTICLFERERRFHRKMRGSQRVRQITRRLHALGACRQITL